jgi:hypothetical protein
MGFKMQVGNCQQKCLFNENGHVSHTTTKENVWVNRIVKIIFVIEDFNNN